MTQRTISNFNMDVENNLFNNLIDPATCKSLQCLLDRIDILLSDEIGVERIGTVCDDLFDKDFTKEVKDFDQSNVSLHFGKTLRDLKCVILENSLEHVIWIQHNGPKKLYIREMDLPKSHIQDQVYSSIVEVVTTFKKHLVELSNYFAVLSQIDLFCTVMEPVRATFKENYRKIQLVDKIWLHIDVSPDGSPKNLSVLGQFDQRQLQDLLQAWDHNTDIVTNIKTMTSTLLSRDRSLTNLIVAVPACGICYCVELEGDSRVPQPLCNNSKCGVYFHRSCLYEWLITSEGCRTLQFGVGKCPSCSQYIQCSDRDI